MGRALTLSRGPENIRRKHDLTGSIFGYLPYLTALTGLSSNDC